MTNTTEMERRIARLEQLLSSHGINLPEEPMYWRWVNGRWEEDGDRNSVKASRYSCTVYGTTSDRDTKRDMVLEVMEAVSKDGWANAQVSAISGDKS